MTKNDFTNLLQVAGVDGYATLDSDFIVLEQRGDFKVPPGYQAVFADVFSVSFSGEDADLRTSIVLAERGAWLLAHLPGLPQAKKPAYLVVIAGFKQPVDIPELEAMVAGLIA